MIGYLDTSAVVPLLIVESSSTACRRFWDSCDAVVTSPLTYVETAAALSRARRAGRMETAFHRRSVEGLDRLWREVDITEIDATLIGLAADHADRFALRGYDAVHCASAAQLADDELVAATGGGALIAAWNSLEVAVFDTNADA